MSVSIRYGKLHEGKQNTDGSGGATSVNGDLPQWQKTSTDCKHMFAGFNILDDDDEAFEDDDEGSHSRQMDTEFSFASSDDVSTSTYNGNNITGHRDGNQEQTVPGN